MKTKVALFVFVLLILMACQTPKKLSSINSQLVSLPPGTVKVADNFYCDINEIRNVDWREYLFWTKKVFGSESEEYKSTLPDTLVWARVSGCLSALTISYFRDPECNQHPVVGISQQQAIEYSRWRSDRVFENYLAEEGILKYKTLQNRDNHFTIERYFNGELKKVIPDKRVIYYPEYRLPNLEERKQIIKYSDYIEKSFIDNCNSSDCKECKSLYPLVWSDVIPCENDTLSLIPTIQRFKCVPEKENPIYNLRGNVREWISELDQAAGGGWLDKREEILKEDLTVFTKPDATTGFRNVCIWKKLKE